MNKVTGTLTYGDPPGQDAPEGMEDMNPWTVELRYKGRRMNWIPFYTGLALEGEPTVQDVLECLLLDASSYDSETGFEGWAESLGLDTDSRKAERTYNRVMAQTLRLRRLLGDDYAEAIQDPETWAKTHAPETWVS